LLQECSHHLQDSSRKYRSHLLKPNDRPCRSRSNLIEWWKYAVLGTMIKKNGTSTFSPKNCFRVGFISEVSNDLRSRYIDLYVKAQQSRASSQSTPLSDSEVLFLQEADSSIAWGSLLVLRLASHRRLQEITSSEALPTRSSNMPWSSLFSSGPLPNNNITTTSSTTSPINREESDLRGLYRDLRHSIQEQAFLNLSPVTLTMVFSRFALSLDSDDLRTRLVTIILYGFLWNYRQNSLSCDDGLCTIRLGAIRVFGNNGIQLLSCGEHTDEWFHNFDIQSTDHDIAFSFQYHWAIQKRILKNPFSSETLPKPSKPLPQGMKQHHLLEIVCAKLFLYRDLISLHNLFEIYSRLIRTQSSEASLESSSSTLGAGGGGGNSAKAVLSKCALVEIQSASHSSTKSHCFTKWSVSASCEGLAIQIPLKSLPMRSSRPLTSETPSSSIQFRFGRCSLHSGDFLSALEMFHPSNPISVPGTGGGGGGGGGLSVADQNNALPSEDSIHYPESAKENRFYSAIHGVWLNKEKIMRYKVKKQIGGPLLQHCVCTIQNFEMNGLFPHHQTNFTDLPLNLQLLLTWSSRLFHEAPALTVDLLSSSAHFSFGTMVSPNLLIPPWLPSHISFFCLVL
jgi:hypothetical protein